MLGVIDALRMNLRNDVLVLNIYKDMKKKIYS